jgi:hypothetical protein
MFLYFLTPASNSGICVTHIKELKYMVISGIIFMSNILDVLNHSIILLIL